MLVANNAPNFERNDLDIHFFRYSGAIIRGPPSGGHTTVRRLPPERHSYPEGIATRRNEAFGEHGNLGRRAFGKTRATRASRPEAGYPKDTSHPGARAVRGMRVTRGAGHLRARDIREVREHRQSRGTTARRLPPGRHGYPGSMATRGSETSGDAARSRTIRPQPSPRSPNLLANSPMTCGCPRTRRACGCRRRCLCGPCA